MYVMTITDRQALIHTWIFKTMDAVMTRLRTLPERTPVTLELPNGDVWKGAAIDIRNR